MACCNLVVSFLARIGCSHAAAMHKEPDRQWTVFDWLLHFLEEEKYLFPLLRKSDAKKLKKDHELFRKEIHQFGFIVSWDIVKQHSAIEDELIQNLVYNDA